MEFLIVSGLSGAGKSTVMSILEDSGFFCVDNLPPVLIPKFAEVCLAGMGSYERVAMVCDIRAGEQFDGLFQAMDTLKVSRSTRSRTWAMSFTMSPQVAPPRLITKPGWPWCATSGPGSSSTGCFRPWTP